MSIYFWDHILYMIVYVTTKSVMNKQWIKGIFQVMKNPTLNPTPCRLHVIDGFGQRTMIIYDRWTKVDGETVHFMDGRP